MRKLALVLVVLVLAGIGGFFGLRAYADREAGRQVDALLAQLDAGGVKSTHGAVGFDLMSRTLDIAPLDFASPMGSTKIGRLVATGVEQPASDRLKAARIELTDVAVEFVQPTGTVRYAIPSLVVESYEGPAAVTAPDGNPAGVMRAFVADIAAERITIAPFTSTMRAGEESMDATYGTTVLSGITGGIIAKATTEPSRMVIKSKSDAPASTAEFGRSSGERIDIALTLAPLASGFAASSDTFQTAYGRVTLDSMRMEIDPGLVTETGAITLTDVALTLKPGLIDELNEIAARRDPSGDFDPADMARGMKLTAELMDTIRLGGFSIADIRVSMADKGQVAIGALHFGPFADGRLGTFAIEGVEGTGKASDDTPAQPFKLGRFALNGFDFGRLMRLAEQVTPDLGSADSLQNRLAALRIIEGVEVSNLVGPIGDGADGELKLDTFQLSWGNFVGALPTKFAGTLRLDAPLAAFEDQEWAALLADGGAKRATVAIDIGGAWNEADKTVTLSPLFAEVSQAFSASAKVSFAGLGREAFNEDASQALAAAAQATFGGASFSLADLGLYELKIAEVAKENDATPEEVRELFTGIAEMMVTQATEERPSLEAAGKAVLDFLAAPKGKIAVTLKPKEPLPIVSALIASQVDPTSLLDVVDIEATNSR